MTHTAAGRLLPLVATLFCFCAPSTQRAAGQQFYFNSQQPAFLSGFQQPQYEDFFQPQRSYQPSPFQLPVSNSAPQSFSAFQQGSQLYHRPQDDYSTYRQRAPSFLDQITLSPRGFARDQRLLQAYPADLNHPPSTPPTPQDFPSEPDDLGLSTFVDQNLEVDQRPTEDTKSVPRPTQKDRTEDAMLRRKPGTRPQAGSRSNFLLPQRTRGQLTSEKREDSIRSSHREAGTLPSITRRPQSQYPSTGSTRTRGRFSPTTKVPSQVRQFNIRPSKVPFTPRRPLHPAPFSEAVESVSLKDTRLPINVSVHPEDTENQELSDSGVIIRNEEQVMGNSTLIEDSEKGTMLLHDEVTTDEQEYTTYPVTGHTETTDIGDVTATLREEPTTMLKENETTEKPVQDNENNSSVFEVLTMNPGHTLVEEDNFRGFVDSVLIDATDVPQMSTESEDMTTGVTPVFLKTTLKPRDISLESTHKPVDVSMVTTLNSKPLDASGVTSQGSKLLDVSMVTTASSKPLGVSVVTTKSVINGTMFAVPSTYSVAPPVLEQMVTPVPAKEQPVLTDPTESWVVVASVQTSRSVSGTRFLPSSAVKQEEVPKSLSAKTSPGETKQSLKSAHSTESIIDKLYVVESELSSGILTGGFRPEGKKLQLEVLTDMTDATSMPTSTTYKSPVFIRKFLPHSSRTTPKPNKLAAIFDSIPMDDLSRLLPPGFKQRTPTSRRTTTPPTKHVDPLDYPQGDEPVKPNSTSARSSGLSSMTNKIKVEGSSSAVKPPKKLEDLFSRIMLDDVSAFLPPGFKKPAEETTSVTVKPSSMEGLLSKAQPVDVSAFLPPGFRHPAEEPTSTTVKPSGVEGLLSKAQPVDVSAFLPMGFKLPAEELTFTTAKPSSVEGLLSKAQPVDISHFLPPGFKLKTTTEKSTLHSLLGKVEGFRGNSTLVVPGFRNENSSATEAATPADVFRVKFPTRPGVTRKPLVPTPKPVQGPGIPKPKISTGWPTRATTEFTGWPTSSTTPIPPEKLLEMAKTATTTSSSTTSTTTSTTTTSTTTTTTPRPTTPGVCAEDCDLAGTVKLVGGITWVPELLDHNTEEWQNLAREVQQQLETVYRKSDSLGGWFRKIRIDSFSDSASTNTMDSGHVMGNVLVDYFVELTDLGRIVDTQEMKRLFHSSLTATEPDSVVSSRLQLGSFVVDPKYTDFIVLSKQVVPTVGYADEDVFLPQWAIAGIVIGLASLLFVIIFGVTVLVNRNKNNKKKSPTPLTEDMLNELNKNHMGGLDNYGADDLYNMEDVWNDKPPKKRSSGSLQENSMSNLYDSWRSEWNGYYYNAYYGNGNAGSSTSGYSRRRSDYDTNF